jgi:tetraacyldisaccharide 4'-kinase
MNNLVINIWYGNNKLRWLLLPMTLIYRWVIFWRRFLYRKNILKTHKFAVPVIIIGNIMVGGTGKTPLAIWLANYLQIQGIRPGIVSRGYGSKHHGVVLVEENSDPMTVGDEPLLICRHTKCPVVVAKNRVAAVKKILATFDCDIIISDDGLQHYALGRDLEIVVIDGERRFGNGWCLPAGPLREPVSRLKKVDLMIVNGDAAAEQEYAMKLQAKDFCNVADFSSVKKLSFFKNQTVHGVAGIGNPQRFFKLLRILGLNVIEHTFTDHYLFRAKDLAFDDDLLIIMTEKDAVKCQKFAGDKHWFLRIEAKPDAKFINQLVKYQLKHFASRLGATNSV